MALQAMHAAARRMFTLFANVGPVSWAAWENTMRRSLAVFASVGVLIQFSAGDAAAQNQACARSSAGEVICGAADSTCLPDRRGQVICSTPGGGILLDRNGTAMCGPGYCTADQQGVIWCSVTPRGGAATDSRGTAHCTDSCVRASSAACVPARPPR